MGISFLPHHSLTIDKDIHIQNMHIYTYNYTKFLQIYLQYLSLFTSLIVCHSPCFLFLSHASFLHCFIRRCAQCDVTVPEFRIRLSGIRPWTSQSRNTTSLHNKHKFLLFWHNLTLTDHSFVCFLWLYIYI